MFRRSFSVAACGALALLLTAAETAPAQVAFFPLGGARARCSAGAAASSSPAPSAIRVTATRVPTPTAATISGTIRPTASPPRPCRCTTAPRRCRATRPAIHRGSCRHRRESVCVRSAPPPKRPIPFRRRIRRAIRFPSRLHGRRPCRKNHGRGGRTSRGSRPGLRPDLVRRTKDLLLSPAWGMLHGTFPPLPGTPGRGEEETACLLRAAHPRRPCRIVTSVGGDYSFADARPRSAAVWRGGANIATMSDKEGR